MVQPIRPVWVVYLHAHVLMQLEWPFVCTEDADCAEV